MSMLIYEKDEYQVLQHDHLQYYWIRKWMKGDNPRSYDQHYDYFTVETCDSVEAVNKYFKENVWSTPK